LNPDAAQGALGRLRAEMGDRDPGAEAVLAGLLEIADERMAEAIRAISLRRGFDPAGHALVAFGGAGAQHACAVAGLLGIASVVVPADAGLLSALGLGAAVVERFAHRQVLEPLARVRSRLAGWLAELGREAAAAVETEGIAPGEVEVRRRLLNLRFAGQEASLAVEYERDEAIEPAFDAAYREIYGYAPEGRAIELESVRVVASSRLAGEAARPAPVPGDQPAIPAAPTEYRRCWTGAGWRQVPLFDRSALGSGATFAGPCLVFENHSATFVGEAWGGRVDGAGHLVLASTRGVE
jgi:5-oxoprolinase (ATP-hydrolysing)